MSALILSSMVFGNDVASSATGNYTIVQLPAGTYELSVTVPGFKKLVRPGLIIQAAQTIRVDATLEVGNARTGPSRSRTWRCVSSYPSSSALSTVRNSAREIDSSVLQPHNVRRTNRMSLKFDGRWRFDATPYSEHILSRIPPEAVTEFVEMVNKLAPQADRWDTLELFKRHFVEATGSTS